MALFWGFYYNKIIVCLSVAETIIEHYVFFRFICISYNLCFIFIYSAKSLFWIISGFAVINFIFFKLRICWVLTHFTKSDFHRKTPLWNFIFNLCLYSNKRIVLYFNHVLPKAFNLIDILIGAFLSADLKKQRKKATLVCLLIF